PALPHYARRVTLGPRYRALVYLTLPTSFLVVVWGGVVRVSGSGLGCPDWPSCHGQFLPSLDPATRIEWFHRFLGIVGGLTLAALGVATVVAHRANRRVLALVVAAGILYIFQAVIGAIVVILELPQTWVTAHLANAELILAVLTTLAVGVRWPSTIAARDRGAPWTALLLAGAVGTFVLMLTGAYVRGDDATTACTTWPLCDDGSLPVFGAAAVHMAHRWVAAIVGGVPSFGLLAATLVGGAAASGGASALNQYFDRDIDERMRRTRRRPLPSQRVPDEWAIGLGISLNVVAFAVLAIFANIVAATLALVGTLFYIFVYTLWLKRSTVQNLVIR